MKMNQILKTIFFPSFINYKIILKNFVYKKIVLSEKNKRDPNSVYKKAGPF